MYKRQALDRWTSFLKKAHHYDQERLPIELTREPAIEKAFDQLAHLSMNKEEQEIYEARLKWLRDEAAALEKKGQESFAEGKAEGKAEIAQNLLSLGNLDVEFIAKVTGLSVAAVKALQEGKRNGE